MRVRTTHDGWLKRLGFCLLVVSAFGLICNGQASFAQQKVGLPYISDDADVVFSSQPARLLRTDAYRELKRHGGSAVDVMKERMVDSYFKYSLVKMEGIQQAIMATQVPDRQNFNPDDMDKIYNVYVIKTKDENENGFDMVTQDVAETIEYKDKEFYEVKEPLDYVYKYAYIADEKTIVWATNKASIEKSIDVGKKGPTSAAWYKSWQKQAGKSESWAMNAQSLSGMVSADQMEIIGKLKFITGSADIGAVSKIFSEGECSDAAEAKEVAEQLKGTLKLASEFLKSQKRSIEQQGEFFYEAGQDLIKSAKIKAIGKRVELRASVKIDMKKIGKALNKTNVAIKRTEAANNIRQVALSFHNYESAYGKFPPPVLVHPESGKKYSWRIAILPFIEENELYEKYDFTQDWDSEHNMEVTSRMPDVFRADSADKDSTNTSWFMLTGADGMFKPEGSSIRDIADGTSNTIMAVEAKRKVHWAKPEDLEVDPERPFPKLGGFHEGGFNVALADGSVQFLPEKIAEKTLWELYTAAGGEIVDHNNPMIEDGN